MTKEAKKVVNMNGLKEMTASEKVNDLVKKANIAKAEMLKLDQEAVDKIVKEMAMKGLDKHI